MSYMRCTLIISTLSHSPQIHLCFYSFNFVSAFGFLFVCFLIHGEQPVLAISSWIVAFPWNMVDLPEALPLRKMDFPSPCSSRLPVALYIGWDFRLSFLLHAGIWFGLSLWESWTCVSAAVSSCVQLPCCVPEHCVPVSSTATGSWSLSDPSAAMIPKPWEEVGE